MLNAKEGETTECRLCKHCSCMLNTEFTQVTHHSLSTHAADYGQEINFVWPKIVLGRRRWPVSSKAGGRIQIREVLPL